MVLRRLPRGGGLLTPHPGGTALRLKGVLGGRPVDVDVLDVSLRGLLAEAPTGVEPRSGDDVGDACLTRDGRPVAPPMRLTVAEVLPHAGRLRMHLEAADAVDRQLLWRLLEELVEGMPVPPDKPELRIPGRGIYTEDARRERLRWASAFASASLDALHDMRLVPERLTGNVENLLGAVEVPVGLAGPLLLKGRHARGLVLCPLATTEGALVASATRGATALTRAGGVTVRVVRQHMMRVPLFVLGSLDGTLLFSRWVSDHLAELRERVREVSRHAELLSVEPTILGKLVNLHFLYATGDAAGQNMTTACTWHACQWIMRELARYPELQVEQFFIESNVSGDKKVNFRSFISGRGIRVMAECRIPRDVLRKVLKVTPEELELCNTWAQAGSIHAGMVGYNFNIANVLAAVFTATGQDIACVHESSIGQLDVQAAADGVHASMLLPSLILGTVGGGTHLPAQNALLDLMGCAGPGRVLGLAEIVAGYCLALDLSTLAAGASGQFATAHERLGRNRPVSFFTREEVGPHLFEPMMRKAHGDPDLRVTAVAPLARELGSSIITELTARRVTKLVGLYPLRLTHTRGTTDVLVKSKPTDEEVGLMGSSMAEMCGGPLAAAYRRFRHALPSTRGHVRELAIYEQEDPRFTSHAPRVYATYRDDAREAYAVVMELLEDVDLSLVDEPARLGPEHLRAAVRGLAELHAIWLGREAELCAMPWMGPVPTAASMVERADLWDALARHAREEFPSLVSAAALERRRHHVRSLHAWWPELDAMPRTLVHNDFNPRNIAFRRDPDGPRLVAFDWELATIHVPQHDLAELLCFVLTRDVGPGEMVALVEMHRTSLESATGRSLPRGPWHRGHALALRGLAIDRFGLYLMAHTFRHYGFLERVLGTLERLLDLADA